MLDLNSTSLSLAWGRHLRERLEGRFCNEPNLKSKEEFAMKTRIFVLATAISLPLAMPLALATGPMGGGTMGGGGTVVPSAPPYQTVPSQQVLPQPRRGVVITTRVVPTQPQERIRVYPGYRPPFSAQSERLERQRASSREREEIHSLARRAAVREVRLSRAIRDKERWVNELESSGSRKSRGLSKYVHQQKRDIQKMRRELNALQRHRD